VNPGVPTYAAAGRVAVITLNRPNRLNALGIEDLEALEGNIERANADPDVDAVVLAAAGPHFCVGADLVTVESYVGEGRFSEFLTTWHRVFRAVETSGKPVVAAVQGLALAGGFELLQVADLVVVGRSARLGDQHSVLGLFPGGGSTQRLPRLIGRRRATWMLMTGEQLSADQAVDWGLATVVAEDGEEVATASALAERLAALSTSGLRAIKAALALEELPIEEALASDVAIAVSHMSSRDAAIGLASFKNRTPPAFEDR
jgi:enoyl-CoA hydratase